MKCGQAVVFVTMYYSPTTLHLKEDSTHIPGAADTLVTKVLQAQYPNTRRQNCNLLHVICIISIYQYINYAAN